jgi:hypothetical protein
MPGLWFIGNRYFEFAMSMHKEEKGPVTAAALVAIGAIISSGTLIGCLLLLQAVKKT